MAGELGALLLGDARLPVGGHAYSAGLEPGLIAGMPASAVPGYLRARLRTVGLVEAAAAVLAHRAAVAAPEALADVQEALLARTPSAPLRDVSGKLGRGLVRLAGRLWPGHPAVAALHEFGQAPQRPIAFGVVAAASGVGEAHAARASLYDDAQTVASASLKLAPVDPIDAVGWVLDTEPLIAGLVTEALTVTTPESLPATTAPQTEGWSLEHRHQTRRIFVA